MKKFIEITGVMLLVTTVAVAADKDHPAPFEPHFADRAAWERRAECLRNQVLVAEGLWPMPAKPPLKPVIHGKIDRGEYTIEKVFFASLPGHYVSGNLYRPKGRDGKLPVVLCPYGHWPEGRFIWKSEADIKKDIDSGAETDPNAARSPLQANCVALARMGCVVFHYDMVGFADSKKIEHRAGFTDAEAALRAQSFMGLQTWNGFRAVDFVLDLPDVDSSRVAVTGSSGGGTQTFILAAVDPRVTATFPMVMVSMNMQGGCVCENAPLLRVGTNNVELACLSAPKPLGAAAANDWTHDFLTRGLPEMKSIWRLYSAEGDVTGDHVNYGHNHNLHSRKLQYAFLNRHFKLAVSEPIAEKSFDPVPPAQLSVYDEAHPLPADATDAAGVRKWMTRAADDAIAQIARDPVAYRKMLRVALDAMLVDDVPADAGDRVRATVPKNFDGRVVVWANAPADVSKLLEGGAAVVRMALPAPERHEAPYVGFTQGYNRGGLAQQAYELLGAIHQANKLEGAKSIRLIGGPAALLARAAAGDQVDAAAIDLDQFDFDRVTDPNDPMLVPGALKYGGIYAFAALCTNGTTTIVNARETGHFPQAAVTTGVTISREPADAAVLMRAVMK